MNNIAIQEVEHHKHLGVTLSANGTWHEHISNIKEKAWKRINVMRKFKFTLDRQSLEIMYKTFIRPVIEYADIVWDNISISDQEDLERIQLEAARIISGATRLVSFDNLYTETCLEPLKSRRQKHKLCLFYKMYNSLTPSYLSDMLPLAVADITSYSLRNAHQLGNIPCKSQLLAQSFLPSTFSLWNSLSGATRQATSLFSFRSALNSSVRATPTYYYFGTRSNCIQHARLRMHCSSLKEHLHAKKYR